MTVLAFDLGASSGRAIIGELNQNKLVIKEIHRFPNEPVQVGNHIYWDILGLFKEIKKGIVIAQQLGYTNIKSIGIDSWTVDFGLLDKNGELLANPYHYRDKHTENIMDEVIQKIPKEVIFQRTGIQFMDINTIYQLYAMKKGENTALAQAETFLMIPELLRYFLTGEKMSEYTNSTTTQLFNNVTKDWDDYLLDVLGLPKHIFQKTVQPGTIVGKLRSSIVEELGLSNSFPVMAVGEHDTASAVAAVPHVDKQNFAYLSCGTWSLLGTEVPKAQISKQSLEWNFTNEGGVNGTYRLLKNIMGLWLIQECHRIWDQEGEGITYEEQSMLVTEAPAFQSFIDPDDERFIKPNHMPKKIQEYCADTNQYIPQTKGEILRCIIESLALKYRFVLESLEDVTNKKIEKFYSRDSEIN